MKRMLQGSPTNPPTPAGTICWEVSSLPFVIRLLQTGRDRFTVQYGLQLDEKVPYAAAATALGEAIMHALACEAKIDNS